MSEISTNGIDPSADYALRVYVESVVRPILAEESEKLRMRKELHGHALASYEDQLSRGASTAEAADRTVLRMGDAKELTAELQEGVPWWNRWTGWVDLRLRRRPETPRWKHAAWIASLGAIEMTTLFAVVALLATQGFLPRKANNPEIVLRFGTLVIVMMVVSLFQGAYLGGYIFDAFASRRAIFDRFVRAIGIAVLGGVLFFGSGWVFWPLLVGGPEKDVPSTVVTCWAALSVIYVVGGIVVGWLNFRERCGLKEWLDLEIE